MKILVSAYACSPYQGSEPGVGWGFVQALAQRHELWVIVEEEKFRSDIQHYLERNPGFSDRVHFRFLRKKRNRLLRKIWPPSYYWYYRRWQKDALQLAAGLHAEVGFDLVHQLTMVGYREPGYLWKLHIPFVWGPVGGMGLFPWGFLIQLGFHGALYYLGYNLLNLGQVLVMRRPRNAARLAGPGLITATAENLRWASKYWHCSSTLMCEVGVPAVHAVDVPARGPDTPLRIVWSGLHIARKGLPLGLKALKLLPPGIDWELHVLGQGPNTDAWRRLCERLGMQARCRFHGWIPRDRALEVMAGAHVLLITSLRDLTSTVALEGMSCGLPVVCLDHCGFSSLIDEGCGIKVTVRHPTKTIREWSQALEKLARDEQQRQSMGRVALHRVREHVWSHKALLLEGVYQRVLTHSRQGRQ